MPPGTTGFFLGVEDDERQRRTPQEIGHRQGRLAATDDDYVKCIGL